MILVSSIIAVLSIVFIIYPIPCESLKCYECSGNKSCGEGQTDLIVDCAGKCMIYRKNDDNGTIIRRCWSNDFRNSKERYLTYFCSEDMCNGIHSDRKLLDTKNDISYVKINSQNRINLKKASEEDENVSSEGQGSSLSCYDCAGHNPDCGVKKSTLVNGCKACMVYLNTYDGNTVIRRCCTSNCGSPGAIGEYEGRRTYFCSSNRCNGMGAENVLTGEAELKSTTTSTTTATLSSTETITTISTTTITTTIQTSFSCYECSGLNEQQCTTTISNCPMCMIYRNDNDPTKFDRRCCWWACGPPNQVTDYSGRPTYFCNTDNCNGPASQAVLGYVTTTSATITITSSIATIPSTTTKTITTATTQQTSSQCYDCSGPNCGREGSTLSMNCPTCMIYRNPNDQTQIERRCCWWACGSSNSVSVYNGIETYFCAGDKCNGYGAEFALSRPVTTTTTATAIVTVMTTTIATALPTTTTISLSSTCVLNCQNGGTPETEDGCFCYCLDNTNGRECENVDCTQSDIDSDICIIENQPLCEESETFAFECLHLCGKC